MVFEVAGLAIPITGFEIVVLKGKLFRLLVSVGVVGRTKVKNELVHVTRLDIDVFRKFNGERTPLVRCGILKGDSHFFLQATGVTDAPGVIKFIVLVEGEDIVVINLHDAEHHRVKADGIKINSGIAHFRNDDTFLCPAHFGAEVGKVEGELFFFVQRVAVCIFDTGADGKGHLFEFIAIKAGPVEINDQFIADDLGTVAHIGINGNKAVDIALFQRLAEEQRHNAISLVDFIVHQFEHAFSGNGDGLIELGLRLDGVAIKFNFNLGVLFAAFNVVQLEVILTVAQVGRGDFVFIHERGLEDFHSFLFVDRLCEEHFDVVLSRSLAERRLNVVNTEYLGKFFFSLFWGKASIILVLVFVTRVEAAEQHDAHDKHRQTCHF